MAFDGSVIACINAELNNKILNGRITKVAQPEKDAILLTIKKEREQLRLLISVNPSLPLIYISDKNFPSPINAPSFCMLLRKHLSGGKIISISQPKMERVMNIEIEHLNEMGDIKSKTLVVELMGKHSNIILTDSGKIIDSIKHVNAFVSSVREVLPGRDYFIPFSDEKLDPFVLEKKDFFNKIFSENNAISKSIYMNITGFSPALSQELLYLSGVDPVIFAPALCDQQKEAIYDSFCEIMEIIKSNKFEPNIVFDNKIPYNYSPFIYKSYAGMEMQKYDSISTLLIDFYSKKQNYNLIRQKTASIRQTITGLLNKDYKKYDLQIKQIKDTAKKDKYRLYGELITAYGYNVEPKSTYMKAIDYNTGEEIKIPLDPTISAIENGKRYFDKYAKLKRTESSLSEIIKDTKSEIDHLESILASLDTIRDETDIYELKKELTDSGYIRSVRIQNDGSKNKKNIKQAKGNPLHYISSDGLDIYVGKNNFQNEFITFELASPSDWWFHAKNIPGSHVIIKSDGKDIPDSTFNDAARLAAHYSKAASSFQSDSGGNVEIDYVQRKHLKKTPGGKPGFVIYHTNYSMSASTDISYLKESSY